MEMEGRLEPVIEGSSRVALVALKKALKPFKEM
jgi:hypothetical protein